MANDPRYTKESPELVPGRKTEWWRDVTRNRRTNRALRALERTKLESFGDSFGIPASAGDVPVFDGVEWVAVAKTSLLSLNSLTDVNASPSVNDVLTYNGSGWIAQAIPTGVQVLDDLTDVDVSLAVEGDFLTLNTGPDQWTAANWTPRNFGVGAAATLAKLEVRTQDANLRGLVVQGFTGQVDDLFQVRDDSSNVLFGIEPDGDIRTSRTVAGTTPGAVVAGLPFYDDAGVLVGYAALTDTFA